MLNATQREQFFKPFRLQILKIAQDHYRSVTYAVIVRNVILTGRASIVRVW